MSAKNEIFEVLWMKGNGNELITSIGELSAECGYGKGKTEKVLKKLEKKGLISIAYSKSEPIVEGYERMRIRLTDLV